MHFSSRRGDAWIIDAEEAMRVHLRPRCELFTQLRVAGAPPDKGLTPARITEGRFVDTGEQFTRFDSWTTRATAIANFGRRWIGSTRFLLRAGYALERPCDAPKKSVDAKELEKPHAGLLHAELVPRRTANLPTTPSLNRAGAAFFSGWVELRSQETQGSD